MSALPEQRNSTLENTEKSLKKGKLKTGKPVIFRQKINRKWDPEVFVIGGGVSKAGQIVIDYIKKYYMANAFMTCKQARFALAELGNDAGIYGAAKMVL